MSFVHLRVHTEFSFSDSIIRVNDLVDQVVKLQMPAVAIADLQNLHCAVKFQASCVRRGIKPIIGVETYVENKFQLDKPYVLALYCQNYDGYRSLCKLLSRAQAMKNGSDACFLRKHWLTAESCQGLIALSGGEQGEIGHLLKQNSTDEARLSLRQHKKIFNDRFYLEVSRVGSDRSYEYSVLELGESTATPIVATHPARFLQREEFGVHEIKVCIQDRTELNDKNRRKEFSEEQYLKSPQEMKALFSDLPQVLDNSVEIAKRCNFQFNLKRILMPAFTLKDHSLNANEHLRLEAERGLHNIVAGDIPEHYRRRLRAELKIIEKTDYAGYFLIVADIIQWAKSQGIQVGPGRGSGAGSLVAYALNITTIDPIEHDLIFERFLNPERVSPPDFDIDFCVEERDRVIEYVAERYGKDQVAQIVTYNTMAARAAVRDVGRAIRRDYLFYDAVAKLIPTRQLDITLNEALQQSSVLKERYKKEVRIRELFDVAQRLEGIIKNVSKHPGGLVISPSKITDYSPLFLDRETGRDVTQFDKDDLEKIGLVKFDFLGLTTLTIIARALRDINSRRPDAEKLTEQNIPVNDQATYDYICQGRTVGIFQLESKGMQRLIVSLQPAEFNDLVALLALFRPGPLRNNMDDLYISNRKNKNYEVLHDDLREVLDSSHGVILYQEQVMKIAQIMSGYSLGEADLLRRAMGKKLKSEMKIQRSRFVEGAVKKGYRESIATKIYDRIESFGGYGFNKSHSVAYALLAYQTAYLKTHHICEFLAACMTVDTKIDSIIKKYDDALAHGIKVIAPDINRSEYRFIAVSDDKILYGLGALKQVGFAVAKSIEMTRNNGGDFKSLEDFCRRIDLTVVSKSVIQALICAGAFDQIDSNRAKLYANLDNHYAIAQRRVQADTVGQLSLFGGGSSLQFTMTQKAVKPWSEREKLRREHAILGFYMSGHPVESYKLEFKSLQRSMVPSEVRAPTEGPIAVTGWIINKQTFEAKNGRSNLYFDLQEAGGTLAVAVYSELFAQVQNLVVENHPIIVIGTVSETKQDKELRLVASNLMQVSAVRALPQVKLTITLSFATASEAKIKRLKNIMSENLGGNQQVTVQYFSESGASANFKFHEDWSIKISDELLEGLRSILGEDSINIDYSKVPFSSLLQTNAGSAVTVN